MHPRPAGEGGVRECSSVHKEAHHAEVGVSPCVCHASWSDSFKISPRVVNGQDLPNWEKGPTIFEFANQLGEQGWELVAVEGSFRLLTFKRPKP